MRAPQPARGAAARLAGLVLLAVAGVLVACGGGERDGEEPRRERRASPPASGTSTGAPAARPAPRSSGRLGGWSVDRSAAAPAREDAAAVTANGYAYLIAGKASDGTPRSSVHYARLNADGSTGRWATTTPLPAGREDFNAVVANGFVYVVGGGGPDDTVFYARLRGDGTVGRWASARRLPVGLDDPTTVVFGDRMYVIGGLTGEGVSDRVHHAALNADGSLGAWRTDGDVLPDGGRAEHTSFVFGGYVYVIGGGNPEVQDEVFSARLHPDGGTSRWQTEDDRLPEVRLDHTTVVADAHAYVIGGIDASQSPQRTVYSARLNRDGSTGPWTATTPLPAPREDATSVLANGRAYVFAGKGRGVVGTVYSAPPR